MYPSSFAAGYILENREKTQPIPIIETDSTKPNFKTKPKGKNINFSVPLFQSEPETGALPA